MSTVADLAEQLHELRIAVRRPSPTDNPLTLRELAVLTGLPHSTLGNAESGRILPRVEVVYRIAQACGVPADELPWWVQARNRIARQRRRPHPATPPSARAPVPAAPLTADGDRVPLEELHQELSGTPLDQAAELLISHDPDLVVAFLQRLNPALGAQLLATMDPVRAVEQLSGLPPRHAVACLDSMNPRVAARLLILMPVADGVDHLALMRPDAAAKVLLAMPTTAMTQRLRHVDVELVRHVVQGMPLQQRTTLLTGPALPEAVTVELVFSLGLRETVTLLRTADVHIAARLLVTLPADPAAGLLNSLPVRVAAKLLAHMPAEQAAGRLMEMTGHQAAAILNPLPLRTAGEILRHLPVPCAARLLAWLPADRRVRLLKATRAERAVKIRWDMETNIYQTWLRSRSPDPSTENAAQPTLSELVLAPPLQPPRHVTRTPPVTADRAA